MNHFLEKTKYKFHLLFTNPKKLMGILWSMAKSVLPIKERVNAEGNRGSTDVEVAALRKYASMANVGIVEIGVLDGLTTKQMAQVAHVPLYGIDPIIPDSMNKRLVGSEEKIKHNLSFYPRFRFFKDFSYNVVKGWTEEFDFIFIDGDHTYDAVRKDFEDWFPKLAPGGYVAFHDSAPVTSNPDAAFLGWPGPVRLVQELKQRNDLAHVETADSLTIFKKL